MWNDILKAPFVSPFKAGSERIDGALVGQHPLPLIGRYLNYVTQLNDIKHRHSIYKWWKHGRLKVVGGQKAEYSTLMDPNESLLPLLGIEHMKKFAEFAQKQKPPTWEEFVSKIDEQDEFKAASVIFGEDFPKNKQDLARVKEPSFRYKKPEQQARREKRHLDSWKKDFDSKVAKVYDKINLRFTGFVASTEVKLNDYRNSEYYKAEINPSLRAYNWALEVIEDLKNSYPDRVLYTESQKGLVAWIRPIFEKDIKHRYGNIFRGKENSKVLFKIKVDPSTGRGQTCLDLYGEIDGTKKKMYTVCQSANQNQDGSVVWAGDHLINLAMTLLDEKWTKGKLRAWERLLGGDWRMQPGSDHSKKIIWHHYSRDRTFVEGIMKEAEKLRDILASWGTYWVKEVGPVEPVEPISHGPMHDRLVRDFGDKLSSEDKNVSHWENVLKAKPSGRKIRQPRTSTITYGSSPQESRHNLLPEWVKTNVTHEWVNNVSVQYNALRDMYSKNADNNRLLMSAWYLRSYIPKINAKFTQALSGDEPSNPFTGEGQSVAPYQIIPIKSITGKLLTYVYFKYNKKIPEINFLRLIPNPNHPKAQDAEVMDLGDGSFEPNWENNIHIQNHIKSIYGVAEIGEMPEEPKKPSRTIGDTMTDEDKRNLRGRNYE